MTELLRGAPRVVSVGLDLFALELSRLGVPVVQLAWSPPAGGDPRLVAMLDRLAERAETIERANGEALARLVGASRYWWTAGRPGRRSSCRSAWCCTRGRRSSGRACARRCRPPCCAPSATRTGPRTTTPRARLVERRRRAPGAVSPLARGRPDDRDHHAARCRSSWSRTARTATARTPPSTRAWARCCASAPTTTAWWRGCAGSPREAGPLLGAALRAARRPRSAHAHGPGAAHGRRDAPAQRRRLVAARARAHAARGPRRRSPPRGGAAGRVRRRQRPVLPQPRDGRGQGHGRSGSRRGRLHAGDDDGAQRDRLRHPRVGARRALVHRARRDAGRALLPGLRRRPTPTPTWATARSWRRSGSAACAMAASPAVARFVGAGGMAEALAATEEMREICRRRASRTSALPTLDDRGSAGRDRRAARRRDRASRPLINTGIAGRRAGTGQVGAGVVRAPLGCFTAALEALTGG